MYSIEDFNERLGDEFRGRLRLRWSNARQEFHLEEKVGRGAAPMSGMLAALPCKDREQYRRRYDERIRADQGYALVMVVTPGTRVGCPECSLPLQVPVMETREVMCPRCAEKERKVGVVASYWPLSEVFIDHLKRIDPLSDGTRRRLADEEAAARRATLSAEREDDGYLHDILFDEAIRQIPKVGYTGEWAYATESVTDNLE